MRKTKEDAGITLIALVVTIVVLLILAGISINYVLGENGIVRKAQDARERTKEAKENDIQMLGNLDSEIDDIVSEKADLKVNYQIEKTESRAVVITIGLKDSEENLKEKYPNGLNVKCNGENVDTINYEDNEWSTAEVPIVINGKYNIEVSSEDEIFEKFDVNITECEVEKYSSICSENTTLSVDGYDVVIPAGFAYGVTDNVKSVNNGLVITDSVDEDGNSNGNEFVYVPIDKTNLTVGKTDKKMAKLSNEIDYTGVLYDFSGTTSEETKDTNILEPYDIGDNNVNGYEKEKIQGEYNEMIAGMKKYGGFYVSRYEMTIENDMPISKIAINSTKSIWHENSWYTWYSTLKKYTNTNNSITSGMIWGSQYDAILNFALEGKNKNKVSSTDIKGYLITDTYKNGLARNDDVINNIYDLCGNLREWTLEGNKNGTRTSRGHFFQSEYNIASSRSNSTYTPGADNDCPDDGASLRTSRFTLYLK